MISFGLDRLFWTLLATNLYMDEKRGWELLLLTEKSTPYRYAVFPLQKDDKLTEKALALNRSLASRGISTYYSQTGSIGKRYARADEIGVLNSITIDFQTLEDGTVTVRNVKDTTQVRKQMSEI